MKINKYVIRPVCLLIFASCLFIQCDENANPADDVFNFPRIDYIDAHVYRAIKNTCRTRWDLSQMIDSTFQIIDYEDEFSVHCDGISDEQLYHFVIRTDKDGEWINDNKTVITVTYDFKDITYMLSFHDFECIKTFILNNGNRETFCTMYGNNPHYSFDGFEAYLNPEIGQLNINCDPESSDFNIIVIRDQNSDPQYYYLLIVRRGDLEKEEIVGIIPGMIEEKVYLLTYYDYDLDVMAGVVRTPIDLMIDKVG
jgi:hypothetical protein